MDALAQRRIHKLRLMLLAFRYLYYVQANPIVPDHIYDGREFELRALVEQYPEEARADDYDEQCPSKTVGSESVVDYTDEVMDLAERLAHTHAEIEGGKQFEPCTTEQLMVELESIAVALKPVPVQRGIFD